MSQLFEEFWAVIPRRNRSHNIYNARIQWDKAIKEGAKPEDIVLAARAWRKAEESDGKAGTEFVPMASTWLHQKRFMDYETKVLNVGEFDAIAAKHGYTWSETEGKYVKLERT